MAESLSASSKWLEKNSAAADRNNANHARKPTHYLTFQLAKQTTRPIIVCPSAFSPNLNEELLRQLAQASFPIYNHLRLSSHMALTYHASKKHVCQSASIYLDMNAPNSGAERQMIFEITSGQNVFSTRRNSAHHLIRVPFACLRFFWTHMRAASISCSHVWRLGVHSALRNQRCMHERDKTKQVKECMQAHILLCYHTFT